jgi:hypothetical protein
VNLVSDMKRNISPRVYALLLLAYPTEFRREYGLQMTQVFRDSHRDRRRQAGRLGVLSLWLQTLVDLIQSAPHEHFDNFAKENSFMNNLRRDALAVVGCLAIIVIAFFLLKYGRSNNVGSILLFGYILDAVITTGLVGNLIVFILVKATRLNPLRVAFWTFLVVHAVPAILLLLVGSRVDPQFSVAGVTVGYVVSFLFWYGLHWMWAQRNRGQLEAQ